MGGCTERIKIKEKEIDEIIMKRENQNIYLFLPTFDLRTIFDCD